MKMETHLYNQVFTRHHIHIKNFYFVAYQHAKDLTFGEKRDDKNVQKRAVMTSKSAPYLHLCPQLFLLKF